MSRHGSFVEPGALAPPAAKLLRTWLEENEISKRGFSKRLGKSSPYVHLILNGRSTPHLSAAACIEDITGIPSRLWVRGRVEDVNGVSLRAPNAFDLKHAFITDRLHQVQQAAEAIHHALSGVPITDQPID